MNQVSKHIKEKWDIFEEIMHFFHYFKMKEDFLTKTGNQGWWKERLIKFDNMEI